MFLTDRYQSKIRGVMTCYDRVVIQGTLPGLYFADGKRAFLNKRSADGCEVRILSRS